MSVLSFPVGFLYQSSPNCLLICLHILSGLKVPRPPQSGVPYDPENSAFRNEFQTFFLTDFFQKKTIKQWIPLRSDSFKLYLVLLVRGNSKSNSKWLIIEGVGFKKMVWSDKCDISDFGRAFALFGHSCTSANQKSIKRLKSLFFP